MDNSIHTFRINYKHYIVDPPAAEIVRHIYSLCLGGKGPMQIAKQLESEQVLIPSAYLQSVGRKASHKEYANPYRWDQAKGTKYSEFAKGN